MIGGEPDLLAGAVIVGAFAVAIVGGYLAHCVAYARRAKRAIRALVRLDPAVVRAFPERQYGHPTGHLDTRHLAELLDDLLREETATVRNERLAQARQAVEEARTLKETS